MSDENQDPEALGWDAIDEALDAVYGSQEPRHWGTVMSYAIGGPDPIQGISAYRSDRERHHLHFVTYGFSELYEKESDDPDISGFGFELTFRLACEPQDAPPTWVLNFLQNLGRYVFDTGNRFGVGHTMPLHGPICRGADTAIRTIGIALDPELGSILSPNGQLEFLQIVGLTEDERDAARLWDVEKFLDAIREGNPLLITDLSRQSYMDDEAFRRKAEEGTAAEGSSGEALWTKHLAVQYAEASCRLVVGAFIAYDLADWLTARLPHGRDFRVESDEGVFWFRPAQNLAWEGPDDFILSVTNEQCYALSQMLSSGVGVHTHPALPGVTVQIERTEIKDNDGNVVEVVE